MNHRASRRPPAPRRAQSRAGGRRAAVRQGGRRPRLGFVAALVCALVMTTSVLVSANELRKGLDGFTAGGPGAQDPLHPGLAMSRFRPRGDAWPTDERTGGSDRPVEGPRPARSGEGGQASDARPDRSSAPSGGVTGDPDGTRSQQPTAVDEPSVSGTTDGDQADGDQADGDADADTTGDQAEDGSSGGDPDGETSDGGDGGDSGDGNGGPDNKPDNAGNSHAPDEQHPEQAHDDGQEQQQHPNNGGRNDQSEHSQGRQRGQGAGTTGQDSSASLTLPTTDVLPWTYADTGSGTSSPTDGTDLLSRLLLP